MNPFFRALLRRDITSSPWNEVIPVREELFGAERLEQHGESLAAAQLVTLNPPRVTSLRARLDDNAVYLLEAYREIATEVRLGQPLVPAAEWLLDNYHLVEEQILEIRRDLPAGYYKQLPKLASGPFAGYPRVFGLAWAFIAHTDSHFDPEMLRRFLTAYQRVQPLTIGELWAVAITLRIVLIENLRRLAEQIAAGREARSGADAFADRLLTPGNAQAALSLDIATRSMAPLSERFAAQLAKRFREQDPREMPAMEWLKERLSQQGTNIEDVVQSALQRQGASNLTVRNIITSMRAISSQDWAELFESVSLVDEKLRAETIFADMDFPTRNLYRSAIEQLARGSSLTELEIADRALAATHSASKQSSEPVSVGFPKPDRRIDPGYYLIAGGRPALERLIKFRPSPRSRLARLGLHLGIAGYVSGALLLAAIFTFGGVWLLSRFDASGILLGLFAICAFIPATNSSLAFINRCVTWSFGAVTLPGLELKRGVPEALRTLVAVPTLLTSEADLREQIEGLEVRFLASAGGDLTFALLSDGLDADREVTDDDAHLIAVASAAIDDLNHRHGPNRAGPRFLLLHRRRVFNAGEGKWMGWERKRGKLHELNRLLRGATDTTFMAIGGYPPQVPSNVRYVITLDADTRLPRDAAVRLIGKMAHPLNRPRFDPIRRRVVEGYGILQPRVTPSLPVGGEGSLYQRIFSGPSGIDPYVAAVSDVYQDLFGEGSYTGKGIYDVDIFEAALAGRVQDNTLLSHDLFEGVYARAGLASDVEVVEDFPARYDVAVKRQHRWVRGDWQLLPWIAGARGADQAVPAVGRWKMLDNLRRSLVAPLILAALTTSMMLPFQAAGLGIMLVLAMIVFPPFLPMLFGLLPRQADIRIESHLVAVATDLQLACRQILLSVVLLADQAWRMSDAIVRTLFRLFVTHRHLLEWTTAAQSGGGPRPSIPKLYRQMARGTGAGLVLMASAVWVAPESWVFGLVLGSVWAAAPLVAAWISRPPSIKERLNVSDSEARSLRLIARRTWRYFETFVTPLDNMLPPDNFQEDPSFVLAHRTSPTNIGLYLLSAVAARDFGWAGTLETTERLEAAFATLQKLPRFMGHFYNWYDTRDLRSLDPAYISAVDSGNLAGHLVVVANACEEWVSDAYATDPRPGLLDDLRLARRALAATSVHNAASAAVAVALTDFDSELKRAQPIGALLPALKRHAGKAAKAAQELFTSDTGGVVPELIFWTTALARAVSEHGRDRRPENVSSDNLIGRLSKLAEDARAMAQAMDFAFLLDPARKLLSIGYSLPDRRMDASCYDLLASEARLASLFAIAKGDLPTLHWFRLGRSATSIGTGSALISWSGSMFEYLMPSLVMRAPVGSLLDQTNRLVVKRQKDYGRSLGVPWGVSESAYNARDIELTYQYTNFGVPGLGLKRGLSENVVVAPYATGLATMIDPHGAQMNYRHLEKMGASGAFGFYEAIDFTRARLPEGDTFSIVKTFMSHHQGMTIVAIANTLSDGKMRTRFHREPMIQAAELLLERMPREVAVVRPRVDEIRSVRVETATPASPLRRFTAADLGAPITHLLSNGRYSVMLTTAGAGYSRWQGIGITRWREDVTRDNWGQFFFLRDCQSGAVWTAGSQPLGHRVESDEVMFSEDHAEFVHREGNLTTMLDIVVSSEDDGEVRRVSLINGGRRIREIDVTSYVELALSSPVADDAHPAFSKMFVQTEHLAEFDALIATRRKRAPMESDIWVAHFAYVEGEAVALPQYETDRALFLGRGHGVESAAAMVGDRSLSGTVGTVLDPIFSMRHRVRVLPGKSAHLAFWTLAASSRSALLDLIDKHHDRNAFDRAKTLAWTQAQTQLRHLDIEADEAADFQSLAAPVIYADRRFRPPSEIIVRGAGRQSDLWSLAISGDRPIVLLRIDDIEDISQVRQLLRAHEYWYLRGLAVDLVIVNERASSYIQDLQVAIETAVRSSQSRPKLTATGPVGSITALRADMMSLEVRALLQSVARVALVARRGTIGEQLSRIQRAVYAPAPPRRLGPNPVLLPDPPLPIGNLEFFNGLGGFDRNGKEYVTVLKPGTETPAPWINVVANPAFGFQVAAEGSAYTWAVNSRENQITPWSNDPVEDSSGEAIYIRDDASGDVWSPTASPIRDGGTYIARHGFGYSQFEHTAHEVAAELLQFVGVSDPIKISRLTLRNRSDRSRQLSVTTYAEWSLGRSRGASGPFIVTERDSASGALLARNPWSIPFGTRVAFSDMRGAQASWTTDRTEFLGVNGVLGAPAAVIEDRALTGMTGSGMDPCAALRQKIELAAGESVEIVWFLGQSATLEDARGLIARYRTINLDSSFAEVTALWTKTLGAVQVRTPNRGMDILLNGWLLYQTIVCRLWARAGFYQASGAYGFRDQLQDGMALTWADPTETRQHILRAAARQFSDGDVQHWWLPHSGQGVRTRISDDRVWLGFATATYIRSSGDVTILDEIVPFLEGPTLQPQEHDSFFQPMISDESASLFEHCARGLDQCIELTGQHGLPLIGAGDWNDGMNRVGEAGKGESVWLGWLFIRTVALLAPLAASRDPDRIERWKAHAEVVRTAIERDAWDGEWYRRATFDDGTWLGSKQSEECQIDSIAQSWAIISGGALPHRAATAMKSLESRLIRRDDALAVLFSPPFSNTLHDPGYIKGYPPGLRENGGQYSHAAMWSILAFAKLGDGDRAFGLFDLLNPINHTRNAVDVARYKVEPYVIAADVYSVSPHVGRGGWTWYTGSAAWMYRAGIEGILGLRREGSFLVVEPCIPQDWPGYQTTIQIDGRRYHVIVEAGSDKNRDVLAAILDNGSVEIVNRQIRVALDGHDHNLKITLGSSEPGSH